jgi:beta-glucosidase
VKGLKGFERLSLEPGETRAVSLHIGPSALQLIDRAMRTVVEPGQFDIMVGGSSDTVESVTLEVTP